MERMKITAGLGRLEYFRRLVSAGADELFAGFVPFGWLEKYANNIPLNRREVLLQNIQIDSFEDMRILADMKNDAGVRVALTFNSPFYSPEVYPLIAVMLGELKEIGFEDWIIADPGLMVQLRSRGISGRIHVSGEAGVFSPDSVRFFRELGAKRIIFPRKISPERMAECIAAAPELEYEAFVLNEMCHYSGAFCSSLHCDELEPICRVPFCREGLGDRTPERNHDAFGAGGCGLCALQQLANAGVVYLKIVGRGGNIGLIERDVRLLRRALDMDDLSPDVLRAEILNDACSLNCYYRS